MWAYVMPESKLRSQSLDFAVSIIHLVKALKEKRESEQDFMEMFSWNQNTSYAR